MPLRSWNLTGGLSITFVSELVLFPFPLLLYKPRCHECQGAIGGAMSRAIVSCHAITGNPFILVTFPRPPSVLFTDSRRPTSSTWVQLKALCTFHVLVTVDV